MNDPADLKKMQFHEKSVKVMMGEQKFKERKRLFLNNKYVLLDENSEPFEDNRTSVRQFLTFFELAKRDYFGGRVLISESNITNEGKLYDENGNKMIPPSQLSVVADSAEVEVLIMNRSWMSLFPEEVQ